LRNHDGGTEVIAHIRGGQRTSYAVGTTALVALLIGCGSSAGSTPLPTATAIPSPRLPTGAPTQGPTTAPTTPPTPVVLVFPDLSEVALAPGRYDSSPPFDIDFTFELS
jgi:hypothetical protein